MGEPAPVDLGELEDSLGFLLRIAQLKVFADFYNRIGTLDLRPGEFSVLWVISRNPGVKQGLLAETLRIKPAHMTKIVRRFEDQGIVAREIPDHDRRSVSLSLTAQGRDWVAAMRPTFFGVDSYHDHSLSVRETRELTRLLRRYAGLGRGTEQPAVPGDNGTGENRPQGASMGGKP